MTSADFQHFADSQVVPSMRDDDQTHKQPSNSSVRIPLAIETRPIPPEQLTALLNNVILFK